MAAENAIIAGLVGTAALFAYYAFQFRDSEQEFNQKISVILFFMSLMFINLTMMAILQIAQQNLSYLSEGILLFGLKAVMWVTVAGAFILLMGVIFMLIQGVWTWYKGFGRTMAE